MWTVLSMSTFVPGLRNSIKARAFRTIVICVKTIGVGERDGAQL